jgi:hypothetical protein
MDPLVIPLHDRRVIVAERMDLLGHAAAAAGLLTAGMDRLSAGDGALAALELAGAAALGVAIVRELRARGEEPARVSWLNLLAAAVLQGEWYAAWSGGGKLVSPVLLSGITAAVLAFMHPVIQRRRRERRALRIDDDGITLSMGRFRRYSARWSELRALSAEADALRFVRTGGGERRVSLRMITNRAEVSRAVADAAERMGIARLPARAG